MIRNLAALFLLTIVLLTHAPTANAQQTQEKFVQQTDYLLSLPDNYNQDTTQRWPLVLFLHGSGESGHDVEKVKTHGPPKLVGAGKKFPFIIVSPQCPDARTAWESNTLYRLLQDIKAKYRVDPDRVYLTGLSMGGFGSWDLGMKHPEEFAAVVPICGGGDTSNIWKLRNMPVWCFHGALDNVVPLSRSQDMVNALKHYNPDVKFTVYPDAYHNSWEVTYNNDSLYTWLLSQKRFRYTRTKSDPKILKSYTGKYTNDLKDSIELFVQNDSLKCRVHNNVFELQPAAGGLFFMAPGSPESVVFTEEGKRKGFLFYGGDKKMFFRKYD